MLQGLFRRLYTDVGHPVPDHIIFNNNCNFSKHVRGSEGPPKRPPDHAFDNTGLAVDVFHFNCKHSKADQYCRDNCDSDKFPELRGEGGKRWWFNTSIAEQNNSWLGGFLSMCQEMLEERYDFFLDEMILMHNERLLEKLKADKNVTIYN